MQRTVKVICCLSISVTQAVYHEHHSQNTGKRRQKDPPGPLQQRPNFGTGSNSFGPKHNDPPTDPRFSKPPNTTTRFDTAPSNEEDAAPPQINQQGGRLREENGYAAPPQQDQQAARLRLEEDLQQANLQSGNGRAWRIKKRRDKKALHKQRKHEKDENLPGGTDKEAILEYYRRMKEAILRQKEEKHKAARVNFHQGVQKTKKKLHTIKEEEDADLKRKKKEMEQMNEAFRNEVPLDIDSNIEVEAFPGSE